MDDLPKGGDIPLAAFTAAVYKRKLRIEFNQSALGERRSLSSTVRETGLRRYHDKPWRGAFVCGKPEAGTVNLPSRKQWRMSPFLCL